MAIHWLAKVPWNEIIRTAPLVVEGAKKLSRALKRPAGAEAEAPDLAPGEADDPEHRIAVLEARIEKLEAVQRSSAELIQSLAANAEKMAEALQSLKDRTLWNFRLAVAGVVGVVVLAAVLVLR